jgi:hypothetical protein
MQVLLGAATLFFCCCRVAAFGSQDLALRTWVSGPWFLALTTDGHRQSWSIFGLTTDGHRLAVADWQSQTESNSAYLKRLTETESNSAAECRVGQTDTTSYFIYKIVFSRLPMCITCIKYVGFGCFNFWDNNGSNSWSRNWSVPETMERVSHHKWMCRLFSLTLVFCVRQTHDCKRLTWSSSTLAIPTLQLLSPWLSLFCLCLQHEVFAQYTKFIKFCFC